MVEMCQVVGIRDQLVTLLLPLVEHVLNVFLIHFQDRYAPLRFFLSFLCLSFPRRRVLVVEVC